MFSPSNSGGPATATRSRRRQRPLSSDNLSQQPKAKRQRLPIANDTLAPPSQPLDEPEMLDVKPDRSARLDSRQDGFKTVPVTQHQSALVPAVGSRRELSVRAKKPKHAERASKGDGGIVLTSNDAYIVSKLPALPDSIRADLLASQRGEVDSSTGYALALTHTHAIVWPYTATTTSPETFTFILPYPSKHLNDPLPIGCLVSPSASSSEPGLVVVMPTSGKITYWDSISTAATLDFMRQERHGVEYSIPAMFSGEKVASITNAESAGFVLSFSSGRLAYMNVRDGHGRPSISTHILQTNFSPNPIGIFGSLRHALGHSTGRGDIAAVRAERTTRIGERTVVALTLKGKMHAWNLRRGGHHDTLSESDLRDGVLSALRNADVAFRDYPTESFEAVDFTFVPHGIDAKYTRLTGLSDAVFTRDGRSFHLFLLVSMTKQRTSRYALAEVVVVADGRAQVRIVRAISSYSTPLSHFSSSSSSSGGGGGGGSGSGASLRPQLYLPRPGLVAFVSFGHAVVVVSLAVPPESPDAQLRMDDSVLTAAAAAPFEDVIDFRDNNMLEIVGTGFEEPPATNDVGSDETRSPRHRTKNPAMLVMVRGIGVLRVATTDVDRFMGEDAPRVTAKSKLEQAVFFGVKDDNPLVFDRRHQGQGQFSRDEYAEAALQLSAEILSSSSPYMTTLPLSVEDNLRGRSLALEKIMTHLTTVGVDISRRTRWTLLWNAEKVLVATLLWRRHESFASDRSADDKTTLVGQIVEFIHEDQKASLNRAIGQVDRVRHWFTRDIARLDVFVAWAYEVIKYLAKDHLINDAKVTLLLHEAVQLNICALMAAFKFRKDNLDVYGLGDEDMASLGILRSGYDDLDEPWTAKQALVASLKRLVELCHQWMGKYSGSSGGGGGGGRSNSSEAAAAAVASKPDPKLIDQIFQEIPNLTDLYLISLLESSLWGASSSSANPKVHQQAQENSNLYQYEREDKLIKLTNLGLWDEAAALTEKHHAWKALALVLVEHVHTLIAERVDLVAPKDMQRIDSLIAREHTKVENLLEKYGEAFAFPLYEVILQTGGVKEVLEFKHDRHGYKTRFLRTKPELAKVSWINDIEAENDIDRAADTLLNLGLSREHQVWSKKIELSLGKLALLAGSELTPAKTGLFALAPPAAKAHEKINRIDRELAVVQIQETVHRQVYQTISFAVDDAAEFPLAMEVHGANVPKKHKALSQIFEDGLRRLIKHEALDPMTLIDLLTLLSLKPEQAAEMQDPFFLALKVSKHALSGEEKEAADRLIWRRCLTRDDWNRVNDTTMSNDREVVERLSVTQLYSTLYTGYYNETGNEAFRPPQTADLLGAVSDVYDERRFGEMDKAFRDKLAAATKWEDSILRKNVEKHRLNEWLSATTDAAQKHIIEALDEETRAGAKMVGGGGVRQDNEGAVDLGGQRGVGSSAPSSPVRPTGRRTNVRSKR